MFQPCGFFCNPCLTELLVQHDFEIYFIIASIFDNAAYNSIHKKKLNTGLTPEIVKECEIKTFCL